MLPHYIVKHWCQKQVINDKLQGSVTTYLRCDGVINNQIKKGLLLSLYVKIVFFLNRRIFGTLCAWPPHAKSRRKCTTQSTFLPIARPNIHRFKKIHWHN